jgi:hypothetical protein
MLLLAGPHVIFGLPHGIVGFGHVFAGVRQNSASRGP